MKFCYFYENTYIHKNTWKYICIHVKIYKNPSDGIDVFNENTYSLKIDVYIKIHVYI